MVIKSIRNFLIISLLLSAVLVSSLTILGDYLLNTRDIRMQQDAQLISVAHILDSLAHQVDLNNIQDATKAHKKISQELHLVTQASSGKDKTSDGATIDFEVSNNNDGVLLHSRLLLPIITTHLEGLQNEKIGKKQWRSYSLYDPTKGLHISVAQEAKVRNEFSYELVKDNIFIILLTYPLIGFAIFILIRVALRSFKDLTDQIAHRASSQLDPVDASILPKEIFPFADALNKLFLRLQQSIEQMKRFSSNASHELRTPLAAIKTQAEVALESHDEVERNEALSNVLVGVDRASHTVKQLLILSRLEPNSSVNNPHQINLSRLVIEITAQLTPSALDKDIDIGFDSDDTEKTIVGDETLIGTLVRNLIDNAIRYTPPGGEVSISILHHPHKDCTIFRVVNDGPGIPAEYRDKVFEPFFRVLGNKESGSGLGLTIVKQIADAHKATINLGVPPSGHGLQIDITFPNKLDSVSMGA